MTTNVTNPQPIDINQAAEAGAHRWTVNKHGERYVTDWTYLLQDHWKKAGEANWIGNKIPRYLFTIFLSPFIFTASCVAAAYKNSTGMVKDVIIIPTKRDNRLLEAIHKLDGAKERSNEEVRQHRNVQTAFAMWMEDSTDVINRQTDNFAEKYGMWNARIEQLKTANIARSRFDEEHQDIGTDLKAPVMNGLIEKLRTKIASMLMQSALYDVSEGTLSVSDAMNMLRMFTYKLEINEQEFINAGIPRALRIKEELESKAAGILTQEAYEEQISFAMQPFIEIRNETTEALADLQSQLDSLKTQSTDLDWEVEQGNNQYVQEDLVYENNVEARAAQGNLIAQRAQELQRKEIELKEVNLKITNLEQVIDNNQTRFDQATEVLFDIKAFFDPVNTFLNRKLEKLEDEAKQALACYLPNGSWADGEVDGDLKRIIEVPNFPQFKAEDFTHLLPEDIRPQEPKPVNPADIPLPPSRANSPTASIESDDNDSFATRSRASSSDSEESENNHSFATHLGASSRGELKINRSLGAEPTVKAAKDRIRVAGFRKRKPPTSRRAVKATPNSFRRNLSGISPTESEDHASEKQEGMGCVIM